MAVNFSFFSFNDRGLAKQGNSVHSRPVEKIILSSSVFVKGAGAFQGPRQTMKSLSGNDTSPCPIGTKIEPDHLWQ